MITANYLKEKSFIQYGNFWVRDNITINLFVKSIVIIIDDNGLKLTFFKETTKEQFETLIQALKPFKQ